jgi:hypothetical protein
MFSANTELQVSDLQFSKIKQNLKTFIANKTEFTDYDFEGSTLSYMLDILAYNTYMNSFYTNMAINETYLDTAQIRANVVTNAKKLGYTPKSATAAVARVSVQFQPAGNPPQLKIPKGSIFQSTKDGVNYQFATIQDYSIVNVNNTYEKTIPIYQGNVLKQVYTYSDTTPFYPILERNVDISTLIVSVQPNAQSSDLTFLKPVSSIVDITPDDDVYFIQENSDEQYELYFGNDVLGKALQNGNQINIEYLTTDGAAGNGLASFKAVGYIAQNLLDATQKYTPTKVTVVERSLNGKERESIESIRFNAPNSYFAQNRLVTTKDYENFVYTNFPYVQSVNVWGGEDHWTPLYGKVILSIKPFDGYALPLVTKNEIVAAMRTKNLVTTEPLIIDPIFTFIKPTIRATYDSTKTTKTPDEIYNSIQLSVQQYEMNYLSNFGKSFRYSSFIKLIDNADRSIQGNETDIELEKRFVPIFGSTISYKLQFGAAIKHPYDGYLGGLTSSGFKVVQSDKTMYLEDDGAGKLRQFYIDNTNVKRIFNANVGTVDYGTGEVNLKSMYFTSLEDDEPEMRLYVTPNSRDYTQTLNQIVLISNPRLFIIDSKNNQITKSGILDVTGNVSPLLSSSVTGTLVTL